MREIFNALKHHSDFPIALIPIYNYFFSNYIDLENAKFHIQLWHCRYLADNDIPKTNNAVEAYHGNLKRSFTSCKYSLGNLIYRIRNEEDASRMKSYRLEEGHILPRESKYVVIEENLKRFMDDNPDGCDFEFVFNVVEIIFY